MSWSTLRKTLSMLLVAVLTVLAGENPKGHLGNPMSDVEIEEKFLKLVQKTLTVGQAGAALNLMWHLEEVDDVGKILEAVLV